MAPFITTILQRFLYNATDQFIKKISEIVPAANVVLFAIREAAEKLLPDINIQ
jgi:hypothetical protein